MDGDRAQRAKAQQERAIATINAIATGADPTMQAYILANEYTDRQEARLLAWLRRSKTQE
jgi:hypothetical protein